MLVTERNVSDVLVLLDRARTATGRLVLDTETTGLYTWHGARLCGISVAVPPARRKHCYYFPFRHEPGGNLSKDRMLQLFYILHRTKTLTGWNSNKFDMHMLSADGFRVPDYAEDVMLMLHLLNENEKWLGGSYELKVAAAKYIDPNARKAELVLVNRLADLGLGKGDMWKLHPKEVEEYANDDVFYTERLREEMHEDLDEWGLREIWQEVNRYALMSRRMEARGMLVDMDLLQKYEKEAQEMKDKWEKKIIRESRGQVKNVRSNPQLAKWLGVKSTAKEVLETMKGKGPEMLRTFRQWDRVLTAYYQAYLKRVDSNGVLHPNIKLHGTVSGRPSAEDPNMQAVPRQTEIYKVKDIFIARPGFSLISGDYSQMELRFGAHYAQDEFLIDAFKTKKNVHRMTAEDLGIEYFEAKQVNFAVLYGTGAAGLAEQLGCSIAVAEDFLQKAHRLHPNYRPLYRQAEKHARHHAYIRLWTGRVRRYNMPKPYKWHHKALSNLIQGGVAEVLRHAIMRLDGMNMRDTHLLLQVHDQLLMETPKKRLRLTLDTMRQEMTRDFPFSVPFVVDFKTGNRWGTLKEEKSA